MALNLDKGLSIAANFAVLLGLIFVGYEISQSNQQMRIAGLADAADNYTEAMMRVSENADLSALLFKAETDYESLTAAERWRVFKWLDAFVILSEQDFFVLSSFDQWVDGYETDWREFTSMAMFREYWSEHQRRFTPEFRAFVERIAAEVQ